MRNQESFWEPPAYDSCFVLNMPTDAFQAMIDKHRARMSMLKDALEHDGRLLAQSSRDPSYSILLTRSPDNDVGWRGMQLARS